MAARRLLGYGTAAGAAVGAAAWGIVQMGMPEPPLSSEAWADASVSAPSRREQLRKLRANEEFDVLIIGGGATGAGAAVDAATRGLRTALIEGEDFGSGTSSRSTKLVHGGVRYLEKAVFQLSYGQLKLVFEALHERKNLLRNAPHLAHPLPIATPCYHGWEVPYYWAGMKAYDFVAGTSGLTMSGFRTAAESLANFPTLAAVRQEDGAELKGTIVYRDGQFDDARLNVSLACTAAHAGAVAANYVRVTSLVKDRDTGRVIGANVRDVIDGGREFEVRAKVVLNCTGPFTDSVRKMSDGSRNDIMTPAGGAHLTLPKHFAPESEGLIVPKTKDGRVVFMLPWLGGVIAGTTDALAPVTLRPRASKDEVDFILDSIAPYLSVPATRADVTSVWSGIRPLAADPTQAGTENVSRDHLVVDEGDGMVTVTGGKWTTYRLMAEHAVDAAIRAADKESTASKAGTVVESMASKAGVCRTVDVAVVGAHGYSPDLHVRLLSKSGKVPEAGVVPELNDAAVMSHLAKSYGDRAPSIVALARSDPRRLARRIAGPNQPVIAAEVLHAVRHEYCQTTCDFVARRTRLAFLDVEAARRAVPEVNKLLAKELGWGSWRAARELKDANALLDTFTC